MENISSEQELLELFRDGKITEDEYKELLDAMRKSSRSRTQKQNGAARKYLLWIVLAAVAVIIIAVAIYIIGRNDGGVDIRPEDFSIRLNKEESVCNLVVSIHNQGDATIPRFKLRFYRGDPANDLDEAGKEHRG